MKLGNTWSYDFVLPPETDFNELSLSRALLEARECGFSAADRVGEDGNTSERVHISAANVKSLAQWLLREKSSALHLWAEPAADIYAQVHRGSRTLSFSAIYELRPYDLARRLTSVLLEALFYRLCLVIRPDFAYATDVYCLEEALGKDCEGGWKAFQASLAARRPPTLLFWLNYISAPYCETIGAMFGEVSRYDFGDSHGAFFLLADHPWEARMARLADDGKYAIVSP